ncbi:MAG TPA: protein-tyrosine phosphatase family protein [Rhizomicrobium sp.]|nr:protein-tyrosine phosphatase family protein [Rhizomicrobium sp.]
MTEPLIYVCPLATVPDAIRTVRPSHLVSLLDPESMIETPEGVARERHLRLGINDIAEPYEDLVVPEARHVAELLRFVRGWEQTAPLLIHCWAGISRSTAAAYIILCDRFGPFREKEIAKSLRARAPHASPNPLLVELADKALGRNGRMIMGADSIGRGTIVAEGEIVELPLSDEL